MGRLQKGERSARGGLTVTLGAGDTVLLCWVLHCSTGGGWCSFGKAWNQGVNIDFIGQIKCLKCGLRITLP